jgi:hypothetical protein
MRTRQRLTAESPPHDTKKAEVAYEEIAATRSEPYRGAFMKHLAQDIRIAIRGLQRAPALAIAMVLSLAQ